MSGSIQLSVCTLHLDRNEVEGPAGMVRLTATENDLLSYMVAHAGRTISKGELLRNVWHYAPGVQSRAPDHTINRLRTKIEADPKNPDHLETVYGVGYRLDLPFAEVLQSTCLPSLEALSAPSKALRGREDEVLAVEALLEEGVRWITVAGPGGIGKTHLVHAIAGGRVALWCDLRSAETAHEVVCVVGQALGIQALTSVEQGAPRVVQALEASAQELLVLDNLEQVDSDGIDLLAGWLVTLPELVVLSTSRVPLKLDYEQVFRLGPLNEGVAEALFRERARAVTGVDMAWEGSMVQPLLDQLGGMPLAIELAAGRMGVLGPVELGDRLAEDVGILSGGREPHHQTVLHTLARSWGLLDPVEQMALVQCTVFKRPFDIAAVEAVVTLPEGAPPVLSVLSQLVDASMLRRMEGDRLCFDFFVLTRLFVEDQSADQGAAVARHMAHFHDIARLTRGQLRGPEAAHARARLVDLLPDLLAAAKVAQTIDPHAFIALLMGLDPVIGRELAVDAVSEMIDAAIELSSGVEAIYDHCEVLGLRGRTHFIKGREEAAVADMERAIELALGERLVGLAARLEVQYASQLIPWGKNQEAYALIQEGVERARVVEDQGLLGRALFQLSRCYLTDRQEGEAQVHLKEALRVQEEVGDRLGQARTTAFLGRIHAREGRMAQAELHFREAMGLFKSGSIPGNLSWVIAARSEVYCRWGRLDKAESLAQEALVLTSIRGTPAERAVAEFNMGMVLLESGSVDRAEASLDGCRRVIERLGFDAFQAEVLLGLGCVHFDRGDLNLAEAVWGQALTLAEETENLRNAATIYGLRGMVALSRGDLRAAVSALEVALESPTLEPRYQLVYGTVLAVVRATQGSDEAALAGIEAVCAIDAGNQIDLVTARTLADRLADWLRAERSGDALDALCTQIRLSREPAGAGLCAATECSTDLRWLIRAMEQHLLGPASP